MRRRLTVSLLLLTAALIAERQLPAAGVPNDVQAVEHALNRLTFGPRAGDVDRIRQMGLDKWIDAQLAPATTADTALAQRLPAMPARPAGLESPQDIRRFGRESVQVLAASKIIRAVHSER